MKIVKKSSTENCNFYSREKSLYIAWACLRNGLSRTSLVKQIHCYICWKKMVDFQIKKKNQCANDIL